MHFDVFLQNVHFVPVLRGKPTMHFAGHATTDLIHKSHNASVPCPTMHHSEQKCTHFCSEWCIVGYGTGELWDLGDRLVCWRWRMSIFFIMTAVWLEANRHPIRSHVSNANILRPRQNFRKSAGDMFKCIFLNENVWISLKISMKFVHKVRINNIPALL